MKTIPNERHYSSISKKEPRLFGVEIYNNPDIEEGIRGEAIVLSPKKDQLLYICKSREKDNSGKYVENIETVVNPNKINEYSIQAIASDLYRTVNTEIEDSKANGEPLSKLTFPRQLKKMAGSLEKTIQKILKNK